MKNIAVYGAYNACVDVSFLSMFITLFWCLNGLHLLIHDNICIVPSQVLISGSKESESTKTKTKTCVSSILIKVFHASMS